MNAQLRRLGLFSIVMITIGSVDSIRNLPATALFGSSLIFFFTLAAIFFLLPSALVSAELASMWDEEGGIYVWVKEAFGKRCGFLAIWFQWIENVIWYPTILSFIAGTIGYLISPDLASNKHFLITVILVAFWGTTIINLLGMKSSARFANFCSIGGLIIPMALIIALGVVWVVNGHPVQISFHAHDILPHHLSADMWVALTGIMMSFCGMEIATVHVREVRNPDKVFPKAMFYSSLFILITLVLGSLSIAMVIPHDDISLVAGIMQAFSAFFQAYHLGWILPVVAFMLILGGLGGLNNWVIAPSRGMVIAGNDGNLPPLLCRENKYHAPAVLLITQAIIVTGLSVVFLLMPSVNGSYWLLTALAAQLYMFMYLFMFAAAIKLRYSHAGAFRGFHVMGGNLGMWLISGAGFLSSLVTVFIGFIPPSGMDVGGLAHYETVLITGLVIMSLPPFIIYQLRRRSWSNC